MWDLSLVNTENDALNLKKDGLLSRFVFFYLLRADVAWISTLGNESGVKQVADNSQNRPK